MISTNCSEVSEFTADVAGSNKTNECLDYISALEIW